VIYEDFGYYLILLNVLSADVRISLGICAFLQAMEWNACDNEAFFEKYFNCQ
jgi:hypothetical protein